ncbi:MAG TPA: hypothetical protein PK573_06260 [Spirochaetota bacterium]|nr:hypothetical protein [Spirochaetota bacterium]HRZ26470.1 hypothetical protein [Spirochaetota bacterium]HSA14594.1 hypothetical protein [Spirochaetota bacterium]
MKMISEVAVRVKPGGLLPLIEDIQTFRCSVQKLTCVDKGNDRESYLIDVVYDDRQLFSEFIHGGGKKYKIEAVSNVLEERMRGGLVHTGSKIEFENFNDYQLNLLGAAELMKEKIRDGRGADYTGISRNIGVFSAIKASREDAAEHRMGLHLMSELDSVIISRFAGFNGFPAVIDYEQPEDLIKTLQHLENAFAGFRLLHIDEADIFLYEQIKTDVSIPVVSTEMDILPVYLLSIALKIFRKNKINPADTTIGMLGVDAGSIRLTQLLVKLGCLRVLGYDHNEKNLLSFENMEGLATSAENIFSNADIVILLKENYSIEEYQKIRPGQIIVSLIGEGRHDRELIASRGVRDFILINPMDLFTLVPGMMTGAVGSGSRLADSGRLIEFCRKLVNVIHDDYTVPDIFSDIHKIVSDLITPEVL